MTDIELAAASQSLAMMDQPVAYLNGRQLPASQLAIPVWDAGFVQGVTVAEQLRTFGGRLFQLDQHLDRLAGSLAIIGLRLDTTADELAEQAFALVEHNRRFLTDGDDLGMSLFVTPGPYSAFAPADAAGPTVGMHTYPVPFAQFARKYELGERLATTNIEQVPVTCWPPALKCRSRMHYYLADRQARIVDPRARALMLDHSHFVTEATTANVIAYRAGESLLSPPREKILPGVTMAVVEHLAANMGVPFVYRDLTVEDLLQSSEVFLCSTSPCVLPVVSLDNRPIGDGRPAGFFQRLIRAWSERVGIDIVQQAQRFAATR